MLFSESEFHFTQESSRLQHRADELPYLVGSEILLIGPCLRSYFLNLFLGLA
jgi:hypothetical protein